MEHRFISFGRVSEREARLLHFAGPPTPESKPPAMESVKDAGKDRPTIATPEDIKPAAAERTAQAEVGATTVQHTMKALTPEQQQAILQGNALSALKKGPDVAANVQHTMTALTPEQRDELLRGNAPGVDKKGPNDTSPDASQQQAPGEQPDAEPKTQRDLLKKTLDDATNVLKDPQASGVDKIIAGITALGALKQLLQSSFGGSIDQPVVKPSEDANTAPDKQGEAGKEQADEQKDEKETSPEAEKKTRRERLTKEMKDTEGGHKELVKKKETDIEKGKENVKGVDQRIDDIEVRMDALDDENDKDTKKVRDLEQEMASATDTRKAEITEEVTDIQEDKKMRDREHTALEENRQTLLDRKERKQPRELEADLTELRAMRTEADEQVKLANDTLGTIADGLKDVKDPNVEAFAELAKGINLQVDDATLGIVKIEGEAAVKVQNLAEATGVALPKNWDTDLVTAVGVLESIATKLQKPKEAAPAAAANQPAVEAPPAPVTPEQPAAAPVEKPLLSPEDLEKYTTWAKNIEQYANTLGYDVTVSVEKDGKLTMKPRDGNGLAENGVFEKMDRIQKFAAARGMETTQNPDNSITVGVRMKDEVTNKGYFGAVDQQFVQNFAVDVKDALASAPPATPPTNAVLGDMPMGNPIV